MNEWNADAVCSEGEMGIMLVPAREDNAFKTFGIGSEKLTSTILASLGKLTRSWQ